MRVYSAFLRQVAAILVGSFFITSTAIMLKADTILTNPDPVALAAAVQQGGTVKLHFDGVVRLLSTLKVTNATTLDATSHNVVLDGGSTFRHFLTGGSIKLRLVHLGLVNGAFQGATGGEYETGYPGFGGSIYNMGGDVEAIDCSFVSNKVTGGTGGVPPPVFPTAGTAGGPAYGGVLYSQDGTVRLTNCVFLDNSAVGGNATAGAQGFAGKGGNASGGALYVTNGAITIVNTYFTNNQCAGGKSLASNPKQGGDASGGALADERCSTDIQQSILAGNQSLGGTRYSTLLASARGGALFHGSGSLVVESSIFITNSSTGGGGFNTGALDRYAGNAFGGALFVLNGEVAVGASAFVRNTAVGGFGEGEGTVVGGVGGDGWGGAIFSDSASALISNCTLTQNAAIGGNAVGATQTGGTGRGGAVASGTGSIVVLNTTVMDNTSVAGTPKGTNEAASLQIGAGPLLMTNSIVACKGAQTNIFGAAQDGGHNISSDASANFTSPTSRNNTDPLLGSLGYYGGPTPTMSLLPSSPAIDAGDNTVCPPTDQRGVSRPKGLACDIGAFELAPSLSLTAAAQGKLSVRYHFKAGETNDVSNSTILTNWASIGTRVSDVQGTSELEQVDPAQARTRFYKVVPK